MICCRRWRDAVLSEARVALVKTFMVLPSYSSKPLIGIYSFCEGWQEQRRVLSRYFDACLRVGFAGVEISLKRGVYGVVLVKY